MKATACRGGYSVDNGEAARWPDWALALGHLRGRAYCAPARPGRCGIPGCGVRLTRRPLPWLVTDHRRRQGHDLRLSVPCPIRVQTGVPRARFRWSAPGGATPSGAVSAGSNPAGGTAQRHKFEHSDNLGAPRRRRCDLRQRKAVSELASNTCPDSTTRYATPPAQQPLAFTACGPFGGHRPLLLPLCCSYAATADTVHGCQGRAPAILRETYVPEEDNPWQRPHPLYKTMRHSR